METQSHLCAAYDRKYLKRDEFGELYAAGTELRKMTIGFIRSMVMPRSGIRNLRATKSWSERVREIYERVTGQPPPPIPSASGKVDDVQLNGFEGDGDNSETE